MSRTHAVSQPEANQLTFFNFPFFSEAAFNLTRDTEQPTTQAVLFTQSAILEPAAKFTGPVHVVRPPPPHSLRPHTACSPASRHR